MRPMNSSRCTHMCNRDRILNNIDRWTARLCCMDCRRTGSRTFLNFCPSSRDICIRRYKFRQSGHHIFRRNWEFHTACCRTVKHTFRRPMHNFQHPIQSFLCMHKSICPRLKECRYCMHEEYLCMVLQDICWEHTPIRSIYSFCRIGTGMSFRYCNSTCRDRHAVSLCTACKSRG